MDSKTFLKWHLHFQTVLTFLCTHTCRCWRLCAIKCSHNYVKVWMCKINHRKGWKVKVESIFSNVKNSSTIPFGMLIWKSDSLVLKVAFFRKRYSFFKSPNLPKNYYKKISWAFLLLWAGISNFKLRIVFWNSFFLGDWEIRKTNLIF